MLIKPLLLTEMTELPKVRNSNIQNLCTPNIYFEQVYHFSVFSSKVKCTECNEELAVGDL